GPARYQFVIVDGLALRLLVVELGFRSILTSEPLGRILGLVQARAAAAIDIPRLIGPLHARHGDVHLLGETVHGLLRREGTRIDVADLLPPDLCELRIIRHVDAGGRPADAVRRAIELHDAAKLRRAFGKALVADRGV